MKKKPDIITNPENHPRLLLGRKTSREARKKDWSVKPTRVKVRSSDSGYYDEDGVFVRATEMQYLTLKSRQIEESLDAARKEAAELRARLEELTRRGA